MRTKLPTRIFLALVCATLSLAGHAQAQTPYLVKDVNPGSAGSNPFFGPPYVPSVAGDRVIFGALRPDVGYDMWSTLGTEASTLPIKLNGPGWLRLVPAGELFTFSHGSDVWSTDGTPSETQAIAPISIGTNGWLATNGNVGAFADGPELYRTDGTPAGTFVVAPPAGAATTTLPNYDGMVPYGNGFAAWRAGPNSVWLWGDQDRRATLLLEGCGGNGRAAEERLFLTCFESVSSLWMSDGSRAGTHRIVDMPGGSDQLFVVSEGRLYFFVLQPNRTLWTSDGTAAGTHAVTSTTPFPADFDPRGHHASNGVFFFAATTPETGRELWRTDGTPLGTFMVRDAEPGPASSLATGAFPDMVAANGGVVFVASTAARGSELWFSDGTTAGTAPLPEIAPGPLSASPRGLFNHRGRVYFVADDGVHGSEPWALEMPSAVSVGDVSVTEGDGGTTTATFAVTLHPASATPVTVAYATAAGSASPGSDFVATAGVLTFAPGQTQASVEVAVVGDDADESNEAFALEVLPMSGIAVADRRGAAVIIDDDAPRIAVADVSVTEGSAGATDAVFPVTLTTGDGQPTANAITVRAEVEYGTADAADFPAPRPPFPPAPAPSVTFPAGTASGTTLSLNVPVLGDTLDEPNETFTLAFDAGNDAALPENGTVTGVILDDDGIAAASPVEIAHGSRVLADLAPPVGRTSDVDFYVLRHDLHSSYEIVVDAVSGDAMPLQVDRVAASGTVSQEALPTGTGNSVAMRFFGLGVSTDHIRVQSAACGTTCGPDDVYRLRMYETTLRSPRVNTVAGQATALVVQNTTGAPIAAVAAYWSAGGLWSSVQQFDAPAHGTTVVDVAAVLPDFSGSVTVGHSGPYGGLVGKVVSVDPATGFNFESSLSSKPR
jgi:ELWxxDGT repeat protein